MSTPFYSNPQWVARTPIITTCLLEGANFAQLWRMWTEWTAEGQSLLAWIAVNIALLLWWNFYRIITPDAKWALRCSLLGMGINSLVIFSVVFFRYL